MELEKKAPSFKVVLPPKFEECIWEDITDDISFYSVDLMTDAELAKALKKTKNFCQGTSGSDISLTSPTKNLEGVSHDRYKLFRLREYGYLRRKFPDLTIFLVERSKNDQDNQRSIERFLVQVGTTGFYMKKSTLSACRFFRTLFSSHNFQETDSETCQLRTNQFMFPEEASMGLLEYLCGGMVKGTVDFQRHGWRDILMVGDYLGCDAVQEEVDNYLVNEKIIKTWDQAMLLLYRAEFDSGWCVPKASKICLELLKSNLHFLISDDSAFDFISLISYRTMYSILTDVRLSYFTMSQKRHLMDTWLQTNKTHRDKSASRRLLEYVDQLDESCPSVSLQLQRYYPERVPCEHVNANRFCFEDLRPTIFMAGGTGDGIVHNEDSTYSRPLASSKSLMAYSIRDDCWSILPDLPIGMYRPEVASNDRDTIFVVDAFAFGDKGAIKEHCMFSLSYAVQGWQWKSYTFTIPFGITSFQLRNLFCVTEEIYMVGTCRAHERVISEWDKGLQHRQELVERLDRELPRPTNDVVVVLRYNRSNGTMDVAGFVYHAEHEDITACVVQYGICIATQYGHKFSTSPDCTRLFAMYNCMTGRVQFYGEPDQGMYVCCSRTSGTFWNNDILRFLIDGMGPGAHIHLRMSILADNVNFPIVLTPPQSWIDAFAGPFGPNPTIVPYEGIVYFMGGWSNTESASLQRCGSFRLPSHGRMEQYRYNLAQLPRGVNHGGASAGLFIRQPISHHVHCPHCHLYPEDVRRADMSDVRLPEEYEAKLVAAYPPEKCF